MQPLSPSLIQWHAKQPYSQHYDDIYFSTENGLAESEYVFLKGNDLARRWQKPQTAPFTIIETGFGAGLNFCCTAQLWLDTLAQQQAVGQTLHYISIEKYPLDTSSLKKALSAWPELPIQNSLFAQYDTIDLTQQNTSHELIVHPSIKLSLCIGDVKQQLKKCETKADAWFLDGFSPAKNPDMWQQAVFDTMVQLSNPNATFATFTSAGKVRRGLVSAGFNVTKRAGFGKKREMLTGSLTHKNG